MPLAMVETAFPTILDTEDEEQNLGAVQVHDPFIKRVLVVAIDEMIQYVTKNNIEIGFKDLGADVFLVPHQSWR